VRPRLKTGASAILARAATSLVALSLFATALEAQSWRTVESSRQLHDSGAVSVRVEYGAGRLSLKPTAQPLLYQMELRYDADRAEPLHSFDSRGRELRLGLRRQNVSLSGRKEDSRLDVQLSRAVPLDLRLDLGAAESDIDLSGLALRSLRLETGASATRIRFGAPNPTPLSRIDVSLGAAAVRMSGLANANTSDINVEGGLGMVELDFGGEWTRDITLTSEVALGGVVVRVPRDVGVAVEIGRVLASFSHDGLTKRGDLWVSDNWDTAAHRLRIRAKATFGKFELDRR
jgi:hypothetical protein